MSNDSDTLRTLPERAFRARAGLVAGVFCLICLGLAVRLLFLQVVGGGWYAQRALGQRLESCWMRMPVMPLASQKSRTASAV